MTERLHGPEFPTQVKGEDENPLEAKPQAEPRHEVFSPEQIGDYQRQAQELIDSYQKFFTTFAQDVSLRFKFADGFSINLESGEVNFDASWFAKKGFSKDQILWATLHELSHFRDLAEDPENMMENFDYMIERGKQIGEVMMRKWKRAAEGENQEYLDNLGKQRPFGKDPKKTMNAVEQVGFKFYHTFYNVFDDIHVNNLVSRKAAKYESSEVGGKEVQRLYKDKLFAESDYSGKPRHLQFLYKLLREEMVPEKVKITREVEEVFKRRIEFEGKSYTAEQIVQKFIKPKSGRNTKAGTRYQILQSTLQPIFEELLAKDIKDWNPKFPEKPEEKPEGSKEDEKKEDERGSEEEKQPQEKPQDPIDSEDNTVEQEQAESEPAEGEPEEPAPQANPFGSSYDEFDENNIDQIDPQSIQDWWKHEEREEEDSEEVQTQRRAVNNEELDRQAKEAQDLMDKVWCEKQSIPLKVFQEFKSIQAEVEPYLEELSELWRQIVYGSSRAVERGMEGYFQTGGEMDLPKAIENWPTIESGHLDKIEIMKRMVSKEVPVSRPELIRFRIIGDLSGSMTTDTTKMKVLRQSFVLLLSSLREFNTYLNQTRSQTKSKLKVDTEAWAFGNSGLRIKKFKGQDGDLDEEQAEIIRIFQQLQLDMGLTYDDRVLKQIEETISADDKEKIAKGKIMEMVFEITDGGSSDQKASIRQVNELLNIGVILRAFQIGRVGESEKKTFNKVWNSGRKEELGQAVGEKISNLLPAITEALKAYLVNVRL